MSKQGVIGIDYRDIINPIPFKKKLLLFDKLIVAEETLEIARLLVSLRARGTNFDDTNYNFNNQTIDFLGNEGFLEFAKIDNKPIIGDFAPYESKTKEELETVLREIKKITSESENLRDKLKSLVEKRNIWEIIPDLATTFSSNFPRLISLKLNFNGLESYPLFTKDPLYENIGKKETVLKFILNQLPEPDDSVSFDRLLDFRKDPNTLKKYYALVRWVNEVAKKDFNLHEIQEEYKHLYYEYDDQFKIHNIKSKRGVLEIIVTTAIDVLSGQLSAGGVSTSFFSLWNHSLNLLEAESNFTGKEIAYIHKAEKSFKN